MTVDRSPTSPQRRRRRRPRPPRCSPRRPRAQSPLVEDLDVPYVTSPQNVVDAMLELARVGPGDTLLDLGSGDGRIVITAATRFGVRGTGIEIDRA